MQHSTISAMHDKALINRNASEIPDDTSETYKQFCRPKLSELLESLKLDKSYHKAFGSYLYYNKLVNQQFVETPVLDFVGGYGVNLLGHNHPELCETLIRSITQQLPFSSQCANRVYAAMLSEKLNLLISGTGKYYCNITNSGTESVEAAIKHAYMVWCDNINRKASRIIGTARDFFNGLPETPENEKIKKSILDHNNLILNEYPKNAVIFALKGAFHGKTTGAVKVTFNKTFRGSFEDLTTYKSCFIDHTNLDAFEEEYKKQFFTLKYPEFKYGKIVINEVTFSRSIAFIFEVVIGEGGVIVIPDEALSKIADFNKEYSIPLIIDEVQTGCGRTGSFFAYANTPLKNINPEYIILSKALGGGLVKIGATMIHEKVYDPEFGLLHTSTFAEDDLSCRIALNAVNIISGDNGALLKSVASMGEYVLDRLKGLKEKYPGIVKDVRGKGLMIGLEFTNLESYNPFFKYAGTQGFISMLVSSYILEHYNIRLLSPLSTMFKHETGSKRKSVIRIQPSVFTQIQEFERLFEALDETLNIIENNNEFIMLAHLIDYNLTENERSNPIRIEPVHTNTKITKKADTKLGFLVHITELDYLINHYLISFRHYDFKRRALVKWWNMLCRFLEPDLMHAEYLTFQNKTVEANIICLPYLPKYMIKTYADGIDKKNHNRMNELKLYEMQDKVQDAAQYTSFIGNTELPVSIVGLGAYNSIITDNATTLNDSKNPVTTGNAYTTALMYLGILKAAEQKKMVLQECTIAVIGAAGNIGKSISELFCNKVKVMILTGRDSTESKEKLLNLCSDLSELQKNMPNQGLTPIIKAGTIEDIIKADIVVVATNSSDTNLVTPDNVKSGSIVCCASVPSNLSEQFKETSKDIFAFDSGYAKLPGDNAIDLIGMPKEGMVFGCLGETILLALNDEKASYKGAISSEKITKVIELAEKFDFETGRFALGDHIKR
jgi:acetylornithine/succinyldiaminopimelate/putrescine aminotransferase/predicted amino acid dehydrogenase